MANWIISASNLLKSVYEQMQKDLAEIKSTIEEGNELTEAKVEKTLDYSKLNKEEKEAIDDFVSKNDVSSNN